MLLCLCLALLGLLAAGSEIDLSMLSDTRFLLAALALQLFASWLFILAWKSIVQLQDDVHCSFAECTAHIGVTLLGKYLPGKVWGLLGRSYLLTGRGLAAGSAWNLLLADQYLTFYTGITLGLAALLAFYNPNLAMIAVVAACLALPLSLHFYDRIIAIASRLLRALTRNSSLTPQAEKSLFNYHYFYRVFALYCAHWLTTAAVLYILFFPAMADAPFNGFMIITAAIPLAMLLGFIAVWAPGGIGVREGTIVAILSLQFPVDLALTIALCYRIICVAIDLAIGSFAVFYLLRKSPELLAQERVS